MSNPFGTHSMAAGYAKARPPVHPLVIAMVRRHLKEYRKAGRALDVGCGAGLSTRPLTGLAEICIGIDPAESMFEWAPAVAPGARFAVARAENLPFAAQSFDLITAAGALNYADLDAFFAEAVRVLRPGGALVVYDFGPGRSFRDSRALDEWFEEFFRRYPPPEGEGRALSPELLAAEARGFALRQHERFEVGIELSPSFYVDYMLTETNVTRAVRDSAPIDGIRRWCEESVAPVFTGRSREVLFCGYYALLAAV